MSLFSLHMYMLCHKVKYILSCGSQFKKKLKAIILGDSIQVWGSGKAFLKK